MFGMIKSLWNDESGATMVEYGLIVALIAVIVAVGALTLGEAVNALFEDVSGTIGG
jgi:pilus assembly protein Flp/PilA